MAFSNIPSIIYLSLALHYPPPLVLLSPLLELLVPATIVKCYFLSPSVTLSYIFESVETPHISNIGFGGMEL